VGERGRLLETAKKLIQIQKSFHLLPRPEDWWSHQNTIQFIEKQSVAGILTYDNDDDTDDDDDDPITNNTNV
jgi:hypothetical protein